MFNITFVFIMIYILLLLIIGIIDFFRIKSFEDFAVAGKRQSSFYVTMSLMATMIGASATIGIIDKVKFLGFPAFWWLATGSIGLILQALLLSEKIRGFDANTLPELTGKLVGNIGRIPVSLIIIIAWPGIVASQILAMSSVFSMATGKENSNSMMIVVAVIVILYTVIGGQLSVIKTDTLQFIIIALAFLTTFLYLFITGGKDNAKVFSQVTLLNKNFGLKELLIQFFVVGGTYLLGPDVISRNLVSKDGKTAKKSALISAFTLFFFSILIVLTGIWICTNVKGLNDANPLLYVINSVLPKPISILLTLGLLSTLLSSADTCLVNISTIFENDILKRNKVSEIRIIAGIVGIISLLIALYKNDIIGMLTGAYSVYSPGIVFPLLIAILANGKRKICIPLWLSGVITGGCMGFINTYINPDLTMLPITGMGISLVLSLLSILKKN